MSIATSGPARPRTKQAFVYQSLRHAIMHCDLAPGERLVIDELARNLRVSAIPVREALHALQSEGLIVNVPHVGATVAPISRESILDVFTLLEALGFVAARLVADRGRLSDVESLDRILDDVDHAAAEGRDDEWASLNTHFHTSMAEMTGLPMLREMTERVLDAWHRVRRYYFRDVLAHRMDIAQQEHRQMLAAMRARDYDRLFTVVHQHNQGALVSYMSYLDTAGDQAPRPSSSPYLLPEAPR